MKKIIKFVNHGTWSHAGGKNKHCLACKAGIGYVETKLKS